MHLDEMGRVFPSISYLPTFNDSTRTAPMKVDGRLPIGMQVIKSTMGEEGRYFATNHETFHPSEPAEFGVNMIEDIGLMRIQIFQARLKPFGQFEFETQLFFFGVLVKCIPRRANGYIITIQIELATKIMR